MKRLPDKPSKLLKLALTDLELVEKDNRYIIDMATWHDPGLYGDDRCSVCFAGAVMVRENSVEPNESRDPSDYPKDIKNKLWALNQFRQGHLYEGLDSLGIRAPKHLPKYIEPVDEPGEWSYSDNISRLSEHEDRTEWKNHMLDLIGVLEAEGL